MSKQRKFRHNGAGESFRWVARDPGSSLRKECTLDEFQSEWPAPPDDAHAHASRQDYYFNSYSHFGIHEDMLKDQVRTGSYMRAILGNKAFFEGKVVLDVGSGTGILCLFAAKAGAKRCIGIECSDIAAHAAAIAEQNGYGEVVTYIRGKVEEVELPVQEVDIIVSEWMGYFLIYESMLDSVLFARDKWLRKDGHIFPDHARLHIAAIEDADYREEKVGFWNHLWGFDFSPMQQTVIQEPISDIVDESALATSSSCLLHLDLRACSKEDLDFLAPFTLKLKRKDFIHALVVWFDVSFEACSPGVVLSTAPGKPYTHWKQTVLYLEEPLVAHAGDVLSGLLAARKSKQNPRDVDVKVSVHLEGRLQQRRQVQCYRLR